MAFLAMMIATLASMQQQQATMATYLRMVYQEYEIMANAVALQELEVIDLNVEYDDLDGLNGTSQSTFYEAGDQDVNFTVSYTVQYVDDSGHPASLATDVKQVTVSVTHEQFDLALVKESRLIAD